MNRWTVLSRTAERGGEAKWHCRCDCGTERVIGGARLRKGLTKSCGCYKSEVTTARSTKHGHATNGISPTYHSWAGMTARCTNPKHKDFHRYGGRGIQVCEAWQTFAGFVADMGEKPKGMTLERLDYNDHYRPGNCRWATHKEQARNKSNNRLMELNGQTKTLAEWVDVTGMNRGTLSDRILNGWTDKEALTTPVRQV
ncbi:hypothetical protein [Aminobacter aminovorans]|uniref:AP2 domain n=1 Tax=Aminobacter aminovorans TaxID=83263 RepID=A0ABR6H5T3_AMIAI|nr:hypothetical protein [Aminobacter aminovorans]MBB3705871.1 hypothetical protein [Aminobacter aminovorans]